jgi:iron(III) transport system substrate-binding protein
MRRLLALVLGAVAALSVTACGSGDADLVVYSGRNEALFKPILDDFAKESGLKVRVRFGDTTDLAGTLIEEGENTRADVFVGQDAGALGRLDEKGLLARYDGAPLQKVPAKFRSTDDTWTGLSARVRVLIVNTKELPESEWPKSIFELTDPKWKGKIAAPNATNASWIGFISELRVIKGDDATRKFLQGLKANDLAVLGSHTDVRNAVGTGEFPLGMVNHYYVELERREKSPVTAVYTDQASGDIGAVVNAASGGILKHAANAENAKKLMDFLLSAHAQEEFAGLNFEYPVVPGIPSPGLKALGEIKATDVKLSDLGPKLDSTLEMLREVGLGD